jgi:hypothetical protein
MKSRRFVFTICAAVAGVAYMARYEKPSQGSVELEFEGWVNSMLVILRVKNNTDRKVSVQSALSDRRLDSFAGVTSSGIASIGGEIAQKEELQLYLSLVSPQQTIELVIVPWTNEQKVAAQARYQVWPKPIQAWLIRKYEVRPEHRYLFTLPPYTLDPL